MSQTADPKAQFELLYDDLRRFHEGFIDSAFKVTGLQLLVIGWLVTSNEARSFLQTNTQAAYLAIIGILIGSLIYAVISVRVHWLSQRTFKLLSQTQYMPLSHFETRSIKGLTVMLFVVANLLLALVTCGLVFAVRQDDTHSAIAPNNESLVESMRGMNESETTNTV